MHSYSQFVTYYRPVYAVPTSPGLTSFHHPRTNSPPPTDKLWGNNQAAFDFFLKTAISPERPQYLKYSQRTKVHNARPSLTVHTSQQNTIGDLRIAIGGPANLAWDKIEQTSDLLPFLRRRFHGSSNALNVNWTDCAVDQCGSRGRNTLKQLFLCLNTPTGMHDTTWSPLATFRKVSIKVPEMVKDLASYNLIGQNIPEDDSVDLKNAYNLREFYWAGDPILLATKFKNMPWISLTVLCLSDCTLSVDDAIGVVHLCPDLEKLTLETIVNPEECDLPNMFPSSAIPRLNFPKLQSLTIASSASLEGLIGCMGMKSLKALTLKLDKHGISTVQILRLPWSTLEKATLQGHFSPRLKNHLKSSLTHIIQFCEMY